MSQDGAGKAGEIYEAAEGTVMFKPGSGTEQISAARSMRFCNSFGHEMVGDGLIMLDPR